MSKATASGTTPPSRTSLLDFLSPEKKIDPNQAAGFASCLLVFCLTLFIRVVGWYYAHGEALKIQSGVTNNYKWLARLFFEEGLLRFYSPSSAMNDVDLLGHPPGYPLLLSLVYRVFAESDTAVQFVQITADACAAVLLTLIVSNLLSARIGIVAGLLAALSPQFSWNSILILPDTISVLPILLGFYLLVRNRRNLRPWHLLLMGVLFGVSILLRANNLMLAPFLGLLMMLQLLPGGGRLSLRIRAGLAASLLAGAIIVVAPITIRNAIVHRHFIPISLGAGQTLLEGIADYDNGRFDIPDTDTGISEQEAEQTGRWDYATTLFGPEGIQRERARLARGFGVIKAHPVWFLGVMAQRSMFMLKFERVPIISVDAEHSHAYPIVLRTIQRLFLTAFMLPLVLGGLAVLIATRKWEPLCFLSIIPVYYFLFQSALHTEYRYVIALTYFLLGFAAVGLVTLFRLVRQLLTGTKKSVASA